MKLLTHTSGSSTPEGNVPHLSGESSSASGLRPSAFGLLSDFGLRTFSFRRAFTLIEVMIACGIFFMSTFAILALVANSLRNARALQQHADVDAGMAAALVSESLKTNKLTEVALSGDFGEAYPDYSWEAEVNEYDTNGLLEVNVMVNKRGNRTPTDSLSVLVYAPNAQKPAPGAPTIR